MTADLYPGEYRVVVVHNKQPSRMHRVMVRANVTVTIEIDAKFDQALRTAGFTGLQFGAQADRDTNEAPYAAKFARMVGADKIAVVGIDEVRGKPAVVGALVSLDGGRELRRASLPVEPDPSTEKLRSLARFLAGDDPAPGLDVEVVGAGGATTAGGNGGGGGPEDGGPSRPRWGGWRWITGGAGLAGLVTGAILVGLDGRCSMTPPAGQQCNDLYATATPGYISLGAGAVFAGISIYLFATHPKPSAPYVAPTQGGAVAGINLRW